MQFAISADHPCLPGHFPGRPLVPGVVLLERVIDAIEAAHGPLTGLRLPQIKFLRPLLPEDDAQIELDTVDATRWRFRVRHDGEILATGEVVAQSPTHAASQSSTHLPPATDAHA